MSYGAALKEKGLLLLLLFSSFRPLSVAASPTVMKMTAFPRLADRRVKRNSVIVCFLLIFTLCFLQFDFSQVSTNKWDPSPRPLVKPEGVIVSGLVFYGRRDRVSCMKCYIEVCQSRYAMSTANSLSRRILSITAVGSMRSCGSLIPITTTTLLISMKLQQPIPTDTRESSLQGISWRRIRISRPGNISSAENTTSRLMTMLYVHL